MRRPTALDQHSLRVGSCVVLLVVALTAGCSGDGVPEGASSSPRPTGSTASPIQPSPTPTATEVSVPEPRVVSEPIPFPDSRKQEMLAYAKRHYGLSTYRLIRPEVIVEHFTVTTAFEPVFNLFAADSRHLGELPGTCAHFVIDSDGTIFQLVPLNLMCRHTVGLNYTAIGIEMVGQSDQDILNNPKELTAALTLTLWLMDRFHIQLRNVIGHNESLTSPLRRELDRSLRCQTHQDWNHKDMEVFRRRLARLAERFGVPLGPAAAPVDSGC